ncbi:GspH/FimT family pseudopilin [Craterilacuibacter sinensis]|nr:GspH/FimT family pseudopilin [Craterilacuibacter sinensis]
MKNGFTLIEMMIVLSVLAIGLAIAMPALTTVIEGNRMTGTANQLLGDLYLARSEAVRSGRSVEVCASTNAQTCSNLATDWSQGWIVRAAASGTLLAVHQPASTFQASATWSSLRFSPSGEVRSSAGAANRLAAQTTITLSNAHASRTVEIAPYGHAAIRGAQ